MSQDDIVPSYVRKKEPDNLPVISNLHGEVGFFFNASQDILSFISIANNHFLLEGDCSNPILLDKSVVDKV